MSQLDTLPIPEKDQALVGDDGELLEADSSVDPAIYADYAASFNELPRQYLNEWDTSRIVEWGAMGCIALVIIALLIDLLVVLPNLLR